MGLLVKATVTVAADLVLIIAIPSLGGAIDLGTGLGRLVSVVMGAIEWFIRIVSRLSAQAAIQILRGALKNATGLGQAQGDSFSGSAKAFLGA